MPFASAAIRSTLLTVLVGTLAPATASAQELLRATTPLPQGRAFHGSAVLGDFLYVFGGAATGEVGAEAAGSVMMAPILEDGGVGEWAATTPLPAPRHYIANSTLALNDRVYILGGSATAAGGTKYNTVIYSSPGDDGTLAPWRESEPFPGEGVGTPAAVAIYGFLHLIGGVQSDGQTVTPNVWSVRVQPDGSLGDWEAGPTLPQPLWFHNACVAGGRVYAWGGLNHSSNASPTTTVYTAQVLATGRLGAWEISGPALPRGFYSATTATAGPYIFSIFPRYAGGEVSSDIIWTYATPTGLAPWQVQPTPSSIRLYHPTAVDYRTGTVYVAGGKRAKSQPNESAVYCIQMTPEAQAYARQGWSIGAPGSEARTGDWAPENIPAPEKVRIATARTPSANPAATAPGAARTASPPSAKPAPSRTPPPTERLPADAVPGFVTQSEAQRLALGGDARPLVLYFTSHRSRGALQQNIALSKPAFAKLTDKAHFAWIDVGTYPQAAAEKGVYQVPTWIFYDPAGREASRAAGVLEVDEIAHSLAPLLPQI